MKKIILQSAIIASTVTVVACGETQTEIDHGHSTNTATSTSTATPTSTATSTSTATPTSVVSVTTQPQVNPANAIQVDALGFYDLDANGNTRQIRNDLSGSLSG